MIELTLLLQALQALPLPDLVIVCLPIFLWRLSSCPEIFIL